MSEIHRYLLQIERDEMEKLGYKAHLAQYLVIMSRHPEGVTATQLCTAGDKDKAAVSRAVAEMIEKGLVTRQLVRGSGADLFAGGGACAVLLLRARYA